MDVELVLPALGTGFGFGCLLLATRALLTAVRLWTRGLRVTGVVTARDPADRRRGGLVFYHDHFGRDLILDPGAYAPLCGLPPIGRSVPVVYVREHPTAARLWTLRHLIAPSFGWFLSSTVAFGTAAAAT
ncbi:hypothetical protein [Streptomyces sp. NPDC086182]|jgi:hypothetical protein|uniref:hypothetical protein n=1 Tax=Streptomyces sp. NPDC086182 TaxID=3155058 RepID=UPI003429D901